MSELQISKNTRAVLSRLKQTDAGLLIAGLLTLFIIQPLLRPGLPTTADLAIHLFRTLEYEQAWSPGVILPRWSANLGFGYGYPLFIFAPPLPYWLAILFHSLGLTLESAFKALIILIILLYAIGMYLFARDLFGRVDAALTAAATYAFAPFALREALLVGGNIPQYLAIGLFPWTLWAVTRAARARSWGWTVAAAGFYAAVMLSHLFHVFIFTPVVLLYSLLLAPPSRRPRLRPVWLAVPLGLLLTAFFWLPAFVERAYTRARAEVYLQRSPFYLRYPRWQELIAWIEPLDARAANPHVPLTLGVVTLALAGLGLVGLAWWAIRGPRRLAVPGLFFGLVAGTAIFLTLPVSRPVWEAIPILQVAEFPWRLLGLANLGLAVLCAAAVASVRARKGSIALFWLVLVLVSVAPVLYPVVGFTRYGDPTLAHLAGYERRSQAIGTTTLGEYLPQTVANPPTDSPLAAQMEAGDPQPERLDRASLPPGASADRLAQTAVTHRYRLQSPTGFTLRVRQFYYPGWQARLDGRPLEIRVEPETGLMLLDIPPGEHILDLHFADTPLRTASGLVSLGTLAGIAAALVVRRRWAAADRGPETAAGASLPLARNRRVMAVALVVIIAAFWVKPQLRPLLTRQSPPGMALPAQNKTTIAFANGIQLIGFDLSRQVVKPGGYLQVVLYWQATEAPIRANLQPFVHLDRLDDFTTVADATNYTPGDVTTESVLPTFHWDTARYVRDEHDLDLPDGLPPIAYAVRVGLIDPHQGRLVRLADGTSNTVQLAVVNVQPVDAPPPPARRLNAAFTLNGDTIRLVGFDPPTRQDDRLEFALTWQADHRPAQEYTIFAQLLDLQQNLVASWDSPPLEGAYPTTTWLAGQAIRETRFIPLGDAPPGEYRLLVGLYDSASGQRMVTPDGADFAELERVRISGD
ncbi:MAG: hypothetical protein D6784_09280 [Chloroflexi bacterium]|nr:MAG: hypothetical protein D6784_09280 [Chloroflexota bacterium]